MIFALSILMEYLELRAPGAPATTLISAARQITRLIRMETMTSPASQVGKRVIKRADPALRLSEMPRRDLVVLEY
jgi:hypothetical protein